MRQFLKDDTARRKKIARWALKFQKDNTKVINRSTSAPTPTKLKAGREPNTTGKALTRATKHGTPDTIHRIQTKKRNTTAFVQHKTDEEKDLDE